MQLDVDVSQPANIMTYRSGLTHLTFDLEPRLVILSQTDRQMEQTDRQTYQEANNTPVVWTGGLKNCMSIMRSLSYTYFTYSLTCASVPGLNHSPDESVAFFTIMFGTRCIFCSESVTHNLFYIRVFLHWAFL